MTQLEQIIELGKLGYSKDEITALIAQPAQTVQQPVATPIQQQTAPAQQAVAPVQPATNNVDFLEALKLLGQQIAQPVQTVQQPVATPIQQQTVAPAQTVQQPVATPIQQPTVTPVQIVQQPTAAPTQQAAAPAQQPSINLTAEDLVKLTQGIAVQTAKGSIETPKSANDIILGMLDAYESTVKKEE